MTDALPQPAIAAGDDRDGVFQVHGSPLPVVRDILCGSCADFNRAGRTCRY
jgi:hypothetical protein